MKFVKKYKEFMLEMQGGKAEGMTLDDIAKKHNVSVDEIAAEFEKGLDIEKEHTDDLVVAGEIAKDHLFEFPTYYTALEKMEKELEAESDKAKDKELDDYGNAPIDTDLRESVVPPQEYYTTKVKTGNYDEVYIGPSSDNKNVAVSIFTTPPHVGAKTETLTSILSPVSAEKLKRSLTEVTPAKTIFIKSENQQDISIDKQVKEITMLISNVVKSGLDKPGTEKSFMMSVELTPESVNKIIAGLDKLI